MVQACRKHAIRLVLEPAVSSDGHRWLTNTYTTELEETHWPASYGERRRDSGDDPVEIAE